MRYNLAMQYIVETKDLSKRYGSRLALDHVNLQLEKGTILGLVGKNGAGKTTLIRVLSDVAKPTAGEYSLFGESNMEKLPSLRRKMATMIERPAFYPGNNAEFNLYCELLLQGKRGDLKTEIQEMLRFVGLEEVIGTNKNVANYSLGMKQRLGIAMALVKDPELLLLDEPTNGLDPEGIKEIRELLLRLNEEKGITILISSHILGELSLLAKEYAFMDKGRIIKTISADELNREATKTLFLETSDNEKAAKLLLEKGYSVVAEKNVLRVSGQKESAPIMSIILSSGLELTHFSETNHGLEDYFLKLVENKEEK